MEPNQAESGPSGRQVKWIFAASPSLGLLLVEMKQNHARLNFEPRRRM